MRQSRIGLLFAVFVSVMLVVIGCTGETSVSTAEQISKQLIINDPEELIFTIGDFPAGWQIQSKGASEEGYQVDAIKLASGIPLIETIVAAWVRVFPSVEAASNEYDQQRQKKAGTFRLDDPEIGDESFTYEGNLTDEVYFRTRNVLAKVTMFTEYGGSLKNVKQWAEKLEAKIK